MKKHNEAIETIIVHGDHKLDPMTGSLTPPLYLSSTFAFKDSNQGADLFINPMDGYFYTRISNPTIDLLRNKIALLEGMEEGLAFGSGMAAIHAVIMSLTKSGDNVVISDSVYGGTYKFFTEFMKKYNVEARWVNCSNLDEIKTHIDSSTRCIYLETPANPTTVVYDMEKIAQIAKSNDIPLVVDNTFMTPYLQQPARYGAEIVLHSATKYICGHADVVAGLVTCSKRYYQDILTVQIETGGIIGPFEAWLLLRGLKTLHIRMEKHSQNAMKVATYLESNPMVKRVLYPGLKSHPQHELSKLQARDFGGIISFELNGTIEDCKTLMDNLHIFTLAISLGDIDSLVQHPATMTHSSYSKEMLKKVGITDQMIRLSIGLENADDLINDLKEAFAKVKTKVTV